MYSSNGSDKMSSCLGLITGVVLVVVLASLVNGYVVSRIWGWFIVPLGMPPIGIAHAIGIALFFGLFTNRKTDDKKYESAMHAMFIGVFSVLGQAAVALTIGWIAFQFMGT